MIIRPNPYKSSGILRITRSEGKLSLLSQSFFPGAGRFPGLRGDGGEFHGQKERPAEDLFKELLLFWIPCDSLLEDPEKLQKLSREVPRPRAGADVVEALANCQSADRLFRIVGSEIGRSQLILWLSRTCSGEFRPDRIGKILKRRQE
jgi:hypothetical protein